MKRIISAILATMIMTVLGACSSENEQISNSTIDTSQVAQEVPDIKVPVQEDGSVTSNVNTYLSEDIYVDDLSESKNIGLITLTKDALQGYTLFTPRHYTSTYLVDMNGELVQEWESENRVEHAILLDNGLLLRAVETGTELYDSLPMIHERLEMVDKDGNIVWYYEYGDETSVLHHDFLVMPNGNLLLSAYEVISKDELIENGRNPNTIDNDYMLTDKIIELKPDYENGGGEIVWQWRVFDHIIQDFDDSKANYGDVSENPQLLDINYYRNGDRTLDWNHVSAIDYNEDLDLIVVSLHVFDEIMIINHNTTTQGASENAGDILYRFGNPMAYNSGRNSDKHFKALHNTKWVSNNEIFVLNNNFTGENSSFEKITIPDLTSDYSITQPATAEVIYDDFHTRNMGGGSLLSNGNYLISDSVNGRILEVSPSGNIVWEYICPVANEGIMTQGEKIPENRFSGDLYNEFFLAYRYTADYSGLTDYDLTPKGIIEQ